MPKRFYDNPQLSLALLGPYKKIAATLLLLLIVTAFFEAVGLSLLIPLTQVVLDSKMVEGGSKAVLLFNEVLLKYVSEEKRVLAVCAVVLTIFTLKNVFIYLSTVMANFLQTSLRKYWSSSILDKYIHAEYDYIISEKRGTLINNLINETMVGSKFIGKSIAFFSNLFVALSIYIMFLIVNWYVTLSLTLIITVVFGIFWKISKKVADQVGEKKIEIDPGINIRRRTIFKCDPSGKTV